MYRCAMGYIAVHTTAALDASDGNEKHDDQTWAKKEGSVENHEPIAERGVLQVKEGVE